LIKHYVPVFRDAAPKATYQVSRLVNGTRVGVQQRAGPATTFGVFLDAGSRYEAKGKNGTAALLQRVIAKDNRIVAPFTKAGATLQSFTDRQNVGFLVTCLNEDVSTLADALTGVIANPNVTANAVDAEKEGLILAQAQRARNPFQNGLDQMHSAAFMGSGLAGNPLGTEECVASITAGDVTDFANEFYIGCNTAFISVGDPNSDQGAALAQKNLGGVKEGIPRSLYTRYFSSGQYDLNTHVPTAHCFFGYKVPGTTHKAKIPLMIWRNLIGQWTPKRGLATSFSLARLMQTTEMALKLDTFQFHYHETGLWGTYAKGADRVIYQKIMYHLADEVNRCVRTLDDEEFERAKTMTKAQLFNQVQGPEATAQFMGDSILGAFGDIQGLDHLFNEIDTTTMKDLQDNVGRVWFDDVDPVVVNMGPVFEYTPHMHLRSYTYWWRD